MVGKTVSLVVPDPLALALNHEYSRTNPERYATAKRQTNPKPTPNLNPGCSIMLAAHLDSHPIGAVANDCCDYLGRKSSSQRRNMQVSEDKRT